MGLFNHLSFKKSLYLIIALALYIIAIPWGFRFLTMIDNGFSTKDLEAGLISFLLIIAGIFFLHLRDRSK